MTSSKISSQVVAKRVIVSGKVQGVGYRYGLAEVARNAHIHGWCRNLPDGTVEAYLEGESGPVDTVLAWMRSGPEGAEVEGLRVEDQAVLEPLLGESIQAFEIRK